MHTDLIGHQGNDARKPPSQGNFFSQLKRGLSHKISGGFSFARFITGKYRSIIIAIGMFILLDASILGINFYTSQAISNDAIGVNLAGRLSTMSQRLIKSLYEVRDNITSSEDSARPLDELRETYQLFDEAFNAFNQGGFISLANGETVKLKPVSSKTGHDAMQRIGNIWTPFKNQLSPVVGNPDPSKDPFYQQSLNDAISFGYANNLTLLNLIAILSNDLEQIATAKAHRLRNIQVIGISLAVINFIVILFHFIAKLRQNDAIIDEARRQTREIMETVNEGLFLIDKQLVIGSEHSDIMQEFFGIQDIRGLTFDGLLQDMATESTLATATDYIQLLFDPGIKENLVRDLNPLDKMEIHTFDKHGRYVTKYLSFRFNRIKQNNEIHEVLVTVNDITHVIKLEKELSEARQQDSTDDNLLAILLPIPADTLKQFINNARRSVESINAVLRQASKTTDQHRAKINTLFSAAHKIKGEAAALSLNKLQQQSHKLEDVLETLRKQEELSGDDFFPFTIALNHLINQLDLVQKFEQQLSRQGLANKTASGFDSGAIIDEAMIYNLAQSIAREQNKSIQVFCSGLEQRNIPQAYHSTIRETVIQLVRNAAVHGIEPTKLRKQQRKKDNGRIEISLLRSSQGQFELRISDDGQGINSEKLRQQAIASGQWTEAQLARWDERKLMSLIFTPGFSTQEQADEHSGRGIGMDVVRQNISRQGGKIRISTKTGQYTRFSISLPDIPLEQARVA